MALLAAVLATALVLAACGGSDDEDSTPESVPATTASDAETDAWADMMAVFTLATASERDVVCNGTPDETAQFFADHIFELDPSQAVVDAITANIREFVDIVCE